MCGTRYEMKHPYLSIKGGWHFFQIIRFGFFPRSTSEIKPYLVFSNRRNITVAPLDGKGSKSIIKGLGNAIAVDYDWQASTIYWSDILINGEETSTTIYATYFNSQDKNRVSHHVEGTTTGDPRGRGCSLLQPGCIWHTSYILTH